MMSRHLERRRKIRNSHPGRDDRHAQGHRISVSLGFILSRHFPELIRDEAAAPVGLDIATVPPYPASSIVEDVVTMDGTEDLAALLDELRGCVAELVKNGGEPSSAFNIGYMIGSCGGLDLTENPMGLFARLHRIHGAMLELHAPAAAMALLQRLYSCAFSIQLDGLAD